MVILKPYWKISWASLNIFQASWNKSTWCYSIFYLIQFLYKDMYKEKDLIYLVTWLEVLSPWCLAGCTSMKIKTHKVYKKFLSFYKSLVCTIFNFYQTLLSFSRRGKAKPRLTPKIWSNCGFVFERYIWGQNYTLV